MRRNLAGRFRFEQCGSIYGAHALLHHCKTRSVFRVPSLGVSLMATLAENGLGDEDYTGTGSYYIFFWNNSDGTFEHQPLKHFHFLY
ncbi:MAG: hypothetical protein Ta2G_18150 [Termitinemataceae bacterium]|nr:MAG: hypothetical protein Ta2G_18150 [Termitinemataceae bacterium]